MFRMAALFVVERLKPWLMTYLAALVATQAPAAAGAPPFARSSPRGGLGCARYSAQPAHACMWQATVPNVAQCPPVPPECYCFLSGLAAHRLPKAATDPLLEIDSTY